MLNRPGAISEVTPSIAPTLGARDALRLDLGTPEFKQAQTEISQGRATLLACTVESLLDVHEAGLDALDEELLRAAALCGAVLEILNDAPGHGLGRKEAARYWRVLQAPPGPYDARRPLPDPSAAQLAPSLGGSHAEAHPGSSSVAALRQVIADGVDEVPAASVVALLVAHEALETRAFGLAVNSIQVTDCARRVLEGATRRGWSRQETDEIRESWTSYLEVWYEHFEAACRRSAECAQSATTGRIDPPAP